MQQFFFGYTKSGKSSIMNFIIGNELIGKEIDETMPIFIKRKNDLYGPEIGLDAAAKTMTPSKFESEKLPGLALWDSPGLADNRGVVQDITGAFYVYQIFINVKSIKIILIIDINDITNDRINSFVELLDSVEVLLNGKMKECFSSIVLIVNKVPDTLNERPLTIGLICKIINRKLLSCKDIKISETVKEYAKYLIDNQQNIGLFKKAKEGPINDKFAINVIESIKNAKSIESNILKSVTPSLTDKSKGSLFILRNKLITFEKFTTFEESLKIFFENMIKKCGEDKEMLSPDSLVSQEVSKLEDLLRNLKEIDSESTFYKKLKALETKYSAMKDNIGIDNLIEMSKLLEFVDNFLGLTEYHQYHINLGLTLKGVISKIEELVQDINLKYKIITKEEYDSKINKINEKTEEETDKAKKELAELKKTNSIALDKLRFFARMGHYMDEGIDLLKNMFRKDDKKSQAECVNEQTEKNSATEDSNVDKVCVNEQTERNLATEDSNVDGVCVNEQTERNSKKKKQKEDSNVDGNTESTSIE